MLVRGYLAGQRIPTLEVRAHATGRAFSGTRLPAVDWSRGPCSALAWCVGNREELARLLLAIAAGDHSLVTASLDAAPALATARLGRRDEFFIAECHAQLYEGAARGGVRLRHRPRPRSGCARR